MILCRRGPSSVLLILRLLRPLRRLGEDREEGLLVSHFQTPKQERGGPIPREKESAVVGVGGLSFSSFVLPCSLSHTFKNFLSRFFFFFLLQDVHGLFPLRMSPARALPDGLQQGRVPGSVRVVEKKERIKMFSSIARHGGIDSLKKQILNLKQTKTPARPPRRPSGQTTLTSSQAATSRTGAPGAASPAGGASPSSQTSGRRTRAGCGALPAAAR